MGMSSRETRLIAGLAGFLWMAREHRFSWAISNRWQLVLLTPNCFAALLPRVHRLRRLRIDAFCAD